MKFKEIQDMKENNLACYFCGSNEVNMQKLGKTYLLKDICAHYNCLLFTKDLYQRGAESSGIFGFLRSDIVRVKKDIEETKCCYCKKKGAHIQCCHTRCKKAFHLPCGLEKFTLHQFYDDFLSYCPDHRPVQDIPPNIRFKKSNCPICLTLVDTRFLESAIWAKCCNYPVFHRECIQNQAFSSGYFFRCPLCNNTDEFKKEMKFCGIYIPDQDASWEIEGNGFRDLLARYRHCDAENCHCPKGRDNHTVRGKWKFFICESCGSQGTHQFCSGLGTEESWECKDCTGILTKADERAVPEEASDDINEDSSDTNSVACPDSTSGGQEVPCSSRPDDTRAASNKRKLPDPILDVEVPTRISVSMRERLSDPNPEYIHNCLYELEDDLTPACWDAFRERCRNPQEQNPHKRLRNTCVNWKLLMETGFKVTMDDNNRVMRIDPLLPPKHKQTARKSCRNGRVSQHQAAALRQLIPRNSQQSETSTSSEESPPPYQRPNEVFSRQNPQQQNNNMVGTITDQIQNIRFKIGYAENGKVSVRPINDGSLVESALNCLRQRPIPQGPNIVEDDDIEYIGTTRGRVFVDLTNEED